MNHSRSLSKLEFSSTIDYVAPRSFNINEAKYMIESLIQQLINQHKEYDYDKCTKLSKDLSHRVKDAMKSLNYEQYKYVIQVVIGNCQDENLVMTCRCLWDIQRDNYVSYAYSNRKIFCAVTVFALFYY